MRYRFAEFTLDTDRETLAGPHGAIALRRRAFALLVTLLEEAPALVTHDRILDRVWGHDALSPNVLPQTVSEIRQALSDSAQAPRLIETRHRRGYRMLVAVERIDDGANDEATAAAPAAADEAVVAPAPARSRRARFALAALALLAVTAIAVAWAWRATPPRPAIALQAPTSLALLAERAADAPDWIADAGTELLAVALAGTERLQLLRGDGGGGEVTPGDARWQYWARDVLGADFALSGTWSTSGDGVAFDYALLRLSDNHVVHAATARAADLAGACREVAARVREHFHLLDAAPAWLAGLPAGDAQRSAYYRGVAALAHGATGAALAELESAAADGSERALLALADAYVRAGEMAKARATFARVLATTRSTLTVGERLRLEAGAALADDRPRDAVASLRALHELAPRDGDIAFELLDAQLRARMADAAAATLASLGRLGLRESEDPRWHLAAARLAELRHDPAAREAAAARALELAQRHARPALAVEAALEHAAAQRAQGRLAAARDELEPLLAGELPASLRPDVQRALGSLLRDLGEFDAAQAMLQAARDGNAALGNRARTLEAVIDLHTVESERGRSKTAYAELLAFEPDVAALDDPALLARFHNTLGVQATRNGDLAAATTHLERAASQARRANRPAQEAGAWNNLGQAYARGRRPAEAQAVWERALEGFRDAGDRLGEAITLSNLGATAHRMQQAERGNELSRQALALLRELGASQHAARTAFNLGLQVERQGNVDEAAALFEEAFEAYRGGSGRDAALHALAALARTQLARGEPAIARATLDAAAADIAQARDPLARSLVDTARANIEEAAGDFAASRRLHESAQALRREAGRDDWTWLSELALHRLDLLAGGRAEPVRAGAERIAERYARAGDEDGELSARLLETTALIRMQRRGDAVATIERSQALADRSRDLRRIHELDRLRVLAGESSPAAQAARLEALAAEATRAGDRLLAWRCLLDAARPAGERLAALQQQVEAAGLAGLLQPLP